MASRSTSWGYVNHLRTVTHTVEIQSAFLADATCAFVPYPQ